MKSQLRARSHRTTRNAPLLWLCGVLLMALTMSRQLVICQHLDGDAHIEFDHATGCATEDPVAGGEGHACTCGSHGAGGDGAGEDCQLPDDHDPHDSCTHTDLLVDVGPEQRCDPFELPTHLVCRWPHCAIAITLWPAGDSLTLHPRGTGPPPGLRRFLLQRATTQLLI